MLYTYEHNSDREIWTSLNDLTGPEFKQLGLTLIDTGDDDPHIVWDDSFQTWMRQYLEESGLPWLRWLPDHLSNNRLYQRIKA